MAGSWNHAVDDQGRLLPAPRLAGMLESGGDVYEFAEEAYGMVWYLARAVAGMDDQIPWIIENARKHYLTGLNASPSVAGEYAEEEK